MIIINSLSLDTTATSISVDVDAGAGETIIKMVLWDSLTYKDPTKAIDLTSLLNGTVQNEVLTILASDAGLTKFGSLFYVEFTTSTSVQMGVVANFIAYHECILDRSLAVEVVGCKIVKPLCDNENNVLFINTLLDSLYTAVLFGLFTEANSMIETLNELCTTCTVCPDFGDAILLQGLGFKTITNVITQI